MVELCSINPYPRVRILAKLEGNNPGGSVKDRPARQMILAAEKSGELTHDKVILEPTSGNTGIALAMIAAARGYRIKLAMPACVSVERRSVLEAYGAEIVLSPGCEATDGAIRLAHKIYEADPDTYYMPNQYANPNNVLAHYETTGPEIMRQTDGEITHFVAGMGTSGTLMGTARYFGEVKPEVRIIGIEPVLGHKIQGLKNMREAIVPPIYHEEALSQKMVVEDDAAFETARTAGDPRRHLLRHVRRRCRGRGAQPGCRAGLRHDRGDHPRSRRPLPEHQPLQIHVRQHCPP